MKFVTVLAGILVGLSSTQGEHLQETKQECGKPSVDNWISARIVNGSATPIENFPWTVKVHIYYYQWNGCCGVILTARHVLTAAHCVKRRGLMEPTQIKVSYGAALHAKGRTVSVTTFYRHTYFNETTYNHDIAMLILTKPIAMGSTARHICLPSRRMSLVNAVTIVAGWGTTSQGISGGTAELRYTKQIVWSTEKCKQKLKSFNESTQICAYDEYSDACGGDSGGPLMVQNGERFELVGLVSSGIGCNKRDMPGAYTRIVRYMNWIRKVMAHSKLG